MKTIKLLYPEWQGYGEDNRVYKGAYALLDAFAGGDAFFEVDVPEDENLIVDGGILGREPIVRDATTALDYLTTLQPDRIFMIGGTCGSEIAPVSYLNQHYDGDLAVLWFDAHADLNTPQSSPSGHFHGMVLRTLLGDGDRKIKQLVPHPLSPRQVTLVGARDLDPPETRYASEAQIPVIAPQDLFDSSTVMAAVQRCKPSHIYIHLDLDFFDPGDFKGALIAADGGITVDRLAPVLSDLNSRYTVVGLSIVEFASSNISMATQMPVLFQKSGITWADN